MKKITSNIITALVVVLLVLGFTKMFLIGFDKDAEIQHQKVKEYIGEVM